MHSPHTLLVCASLIAAASLSTLFTGCAAAPKVEAAAELSESQRAAISDTRRAPNARVDFSLHNLANVSTPGYKALRAMPGGDATDTIVMLDTQQGSPVATHRPFDLFINGDGWFRVESTDGGCMYTRGGRFTLNADQELVTIIGRHRVIPAIVVPIEAASVQVEPDGRLYVMMPGESEPQLIGELELTMFASSESLRPIDAVFCIETAASGAPRSGAPQSEQRGGILAGSYECSNVDPQRERLALQSLRRELAVWTDVTDRTTARQSVAGISAP